jgi:hypothetical protein
MAQASGGGVPLFRATVHAAGGPIDARVRAVFREHVHDARALRGDVFRAREQVEAELSRDPFQEAAAQKALADLARAESAAGARANQATVELLGQMKAGERGKVRRFFEHPAEFGHGPHHGTHHFPKGRQPEPER